MMDGCMGKVLGVILIIVGLELCVYLIYFPIFMKKKMATMMALLIRIAEGVEKK
ncbi:MAG: hypothetical protein GY853_10295 [PVC group bacterium]|nr:hypothetical protein [PVC group bacterium]